MKVMIVKELMTGDVSPVAMFFTPFDDTFIAGMGGAGFFPAGRGGARVKIFRAGAGQSKVQNLRGGAGRGGAGVKISGAGQNVSISADLDHLL